MQTRRLGNSLGKLAWGLLAGSLVAAACSGKNGDDSTPITGTGLQGSGARPNIGGSGGKGSGGTSGGAGEGGMNATAGVGAATNGGEGGQSSPVTPGSPVVTITSPQSLKDPNGDGVLVGADIDVVCVVEQSPDAGSRVVDPSTVRIQMLDRYGNPVPLDDTGLESYPAKSTANANEYSARLSLSKVPDNGRIGFVCLANDKSSPPLTGSDTVTTFVDHGPLITIEQPAESSAHGLDGALDVSFSVEEAPVASGDRGSTVDEVTLQVGGVDFTDTLDVKGTRYSTSVNLSDKALFPTTPTGDFPVLIHARDKRQPPGDNISSYTFVVDGDGPVITVLSPDPTKSAPVGGLVSLLFKVEDAGSGVDPDTVSVVLNGDTTYHYGEGNWSGSMGDQYQFTFDSTQLKDSAAQAIIDFHARDRANNESPGQSLLLYIDNVAPIVDLDPPNVRVWKKSGTEVDCSVSFDPLGACVNDLADTESRFTLLRALVWDRTNFAEKQGFVKYSLVKPNTVKLYIQPDPSKPFLVNTPKDTDPDCDDIDAAAQNSLPSVDLAPLQPTGNPWFGSDNAALYPPLSDFSCVQRNDMAPNHLCANEVSDLTFVIAHEDVSRPPAIYALAPDQGEACTGVDLELGASTKEGWVCVAGRALDNVGNVGVSRPLRLCYDDPATSFVPDCVNDKSNPPSCTDGCTLPPAFPAPEDTAFVRQ